MPPAGHSDLRFGFLNVAKPAGITAHDVVNALRKIVGVKQIGHGGTLDPMAEGVLPVAIGKATRLLRFLPDDKTYVAEIKLGQKTTTDDITGEVISKTDSLPPENEIVDRLREFEGEQAQTPPLYSAVHVDGKRLYELARKGMAPSAVPSRNVVVYSLQTLGYLAPLLTVRVHCSAGTYIRSIARDLGDKLGCGACLSALVREKAGPFSISSAVALADLQKAAANGEIHKCLLPPEQWLGLASLNLDPTQADRLRHGMSIKVGAPAACAVDNSARASATRSCDESKQHVSALFNGKLVAICTTVADADPTFVRIQPEVVLEDAAR